MCVLNFDKSVTTISLFVHNNSRHLAFCIAGCLAVLPGCAQTPDSTESNPSDQAQHNVSVVGIPQAAPPRRASGPDFAALIGLINMVGWVPGKTFVYAANPTPSILPNVEELPLSRYDESDSQKAAILAEFHCINAVRREYQRGQRRIIVEAFSFADANGAYGAYNLLRHGATTVITRGDASSEDDQSISFWQSNQFVLVYGTSEDDEESKEAIRGVADQLGQAITAHAEVPLAISRLPGIDRVRGTEKLIMGPLSARRFFPAPYIGSLSFNGALVGAVADYKFEYPYPERMKLLCLSYADGVAASQAYEGYTSSLQLAGKVNSANVDGALFKIGSSFLLCQLRGPQIVIVSGARKKFSPMMLAHQVY
jgi:hypothetical protein